MTAARPRLLFYFLHLLGVGHVYRAKRLIEGFVDQGIAVDVVYGGEPIPGLALEADNLHFLPPIKAANNAYSGYLDEDGNPLSEAFLQKRQDMLLHLFEGMNPDGILFEAFPFGRRMVRLEIGALISAAEERSKPPLIVCSVRDILQERKKPGRVEESRDWIIKHFDHVLVHSDPHVISLGETFPLADEISDKTTYTGFVVPDANSNKPVERFDVIVSAGGGAFGGALMLAALEASTKASTDQKWVLITGSNAGNGLLEELRSQAPHHVVVKERVENLAAHMRQAEVSVSQCGYNTAMDVLSAHQSSECRAVFVPYDTEGQSEQLRRAELLEKAGFAVSLPQSRLSADGLLDAIARARGLPRVEHNVDFSGITNSAGMLRHWLDKRAAQ